MLATLLTALTLLGQVPAQKPAPTAAELGAQIATGDDATIEAALAGLAKLGKDGATELWKSAEDKRVWVRTGALRRLSDMRMDALHLLPQICERLVKLSRSDHGSLIGAADGYRHALVGLDRFAQRPELKVEPPAELLEMYAEFLSLLDRALIVRAAAAIGAMDVRGMLDRLGPCVRLNADAGWSDIAVALTWAGKASPDENASAVLERLPKSAEASRLPLLVLLSGTGKASAALWPSCMEFLRSEDSAVRAAALEVFANGEARGVPGLAERAKALLADSSPMVRLEVARVLSRCLGDDTGALRAVAALVDRGDSGSRRNALQVWSGELAGVFALRSRGSGGQPLASAGVPVLMRALVDASPENRTNAAEVLGFYGKEAVTALPALKQCSRDPNSRVRKAADRAIESIEKATSAK